MMMWLKSMQMLVCVAAVVLLYGAGPPMALYAALATLAVSFTTFCLLYDEPLNRARQRIAGQLGRISAQGLHAEEYQRLQSARVTPTEQERQFQFTFLSAVNLISGAVGIVLMTWGIILRSM